MDSVEDIQGCFGESVVFRYCFEVFDCLLEVLKGGLDEFWVFMGEENVNCCYEDDGVKGVKEEGEFGLGQKW